MTGSNADEAHRPLLAADEPTENYGTQDANPEEPTSSFSRQLNAYNGFALLISVIIGSGVFASPGQVDTNVPSPGAALLIWLLGGILAWSGGNVLASLGTAFPGEGGIQQYLKYIYGDLAGFLAAWAWVTCVMPTTLAILSIVFVESIYSAIHPVGHDGTLGIQYKLVSVLVLVVMACVNATGTKNSTRLSNAFVLIKLGSIGLVVLAGIVVVIIHASDHSKHVGGGDWHRKGWFTPRPSIGKNTRIDWRDIGSWEALGYISTAVYASLWGYASWDKANYVANELKNPAKQLPLAINTAIPTVVLSYVLVNTAYYILLPWDIIGQSDAIAVESIKALLGKGAGLAFAALVCLVIAGALNGNIFVAGRLTVSAARKGYLPRSFGAIGQLGWEKKQLRSEDRNEYNSVAKPRFDAPFNALLLTVLISSLYIIFGNFRALLTFDGIAEYTFFFLTVAGDLILRYKEPDLQRPYKPSILFSILFAIVSGFVVVRCMIFAPVQLGVLVSVLVLGIVYYYVWNTREVIGR
ncbi:amino acid transporter [Tothia fuscella]|uniref:Amino acid transporter n=1 Tax=Tothia fuscella TaxID=1048955 RepID=A0A9P4P0U2_9PEZI|nr:amino acid transporter [Tothia fuscella]